MDAAATLLERALTLGASDIHLDPADEGHTVRLRVDGRFTPREPLDTTTSGRLIGRLKVMAELMVYRSDIPQEGRLQLADGSEGRLALIPSTRGEKATIRLFNAGHQASDLDSLDFDSTTNEWLRRQLDADSGLLLVVGPSGSGKTTTLYAAMAEIAARRGEFCQLYSIEDPVERRLEGCTQVQVDPLRQMDFAGGLKYLLRQDPEVIMVGEIRDAETARIAVRAAMTGHLVLSTLHCGRAAEAAPRLLEMGVEDYALSLALLGSVAQRLLRRICARCQGSGCEHCLESGYRGRAVVAEYHDPRNEDTGGSLTARAHELAAAGVSDADEVSRVFGGRA
jgi:general secretion pathway protein E